MSRVRTNLTHGSLGERWKRSSNPRRRTEPPAGNPGIRRPGLPVSATAPALYPTELAPFSKNARLALAAGRQKGWYGEGLACCLPDSRAAFAEHDG